jgi:hypothetical protein
MHSANGFSRTAALPLFAVPSTDVSVAAGAPAWASEDDIQLASVMGEQLSEPLAVMDQLMEEISRRQALTPRQLQRLRDAIDLARHIAMQGQQVARLAGGRLRQSHEKLSLDGIVNQALDERAPIFKRRHITLYRSLKQVAVIVDASLLWSLIDASLDWACEQGSQLVVLLDMKNWPEHGMLVIKATPLTGAALADARPDSLNWHLLTHIAQTMGVALEREISANGEATLLLEFSRTVRQLEGLTSMEINAAGEEGDSSFHSRGRPLAGLRVLLISNDPLVRGEVDKSSSQLGLRVSAVGSVEQAQRYVRLDMPHLIIIDERLHAAAFDALLHEVKGKDPNLGFLEITDEANTFEVSSWMSDSMTRVSRDALRAQLTSLLTLELARAM